MKPSGILQKKTKKETPFWSNVLALLVVTAVKIVGFVITCLLFYWASVQTFAKLDPMHACAMACALLAAMIIWK